MSLKTLLLALGLVSAIAPAQADLLKWESDLGPEVGGASGTGLVTLSFDTVTHDLSFSASFSGLSGLTTVAHFHCCTITPGAGTAGVAVDAPSLAVPVGVSAGSWSQTLDLDDPDNFGGAFLSAHGGDAAGAISAFIDGLNDGTVYLNIHSSAFTGGEIRGFPAAVPAPATAALLLLSLALLGRRTRR